MTQKSQTNTENILTMNGLRIEGFAPLTHEPAEIRGYADDYDPKADTGDYMNPVMLAFFRDKLLTWRQEVSAEAEGTVVELRESQNQPDVIDLAAQEHDHMLELRTRDRGGKVIKKIDEALDRIRAGEFGYCEETGDEIGVGRLLARPVATLSIEAKRNQEQREVAYAG